MLCSDAHAPQGGQCERGVQMGSGPQGGGHLKQELPAGIVLSQNSETPQVGLSLCWGTGYIGDVPEGSEPLASEHPHVSCASLLLEVGAGVSSSQAAGSCSVWGL